VRTKKVSSSALTEMYLERSKRYDPTLKIYCDAHRRARKSAGQGCGSRDCAGKYRGPLHGLPWGAKDLLAVKGYRTTWGAAASRRKRSMRTRLSCSDWTPRRCAGGEAHAGALAEGDVWFGGKTRNPWNPRKAQVDLQRDRRRLRPPGAWLSALVRRRWLDFFAINTCGSRLAPDLRAKLPRNRGNGFVLEHGPTGPICRRWKIVLSF